MKEISMQFHYNGFHFGDPSIAPASKIGAERETQGAVLPEQVDVLIVGCGPAGLTLAAQLSAFPDIRTCIVDQKAGPLALGQADGIACRSMEMFQAFGFAEEVLRESYWVNETTFWQPSENGEDGISRGSWIRDTAPGLSEFPHVILNQARIHGFYLDLMRKSENRLEPNYGWSFSSYEKAATGDEEYPLKIRLAKAGTDGRPIEMQTMHAKYLVGCDGARSEVRKAMGLTLRGDSANQAWGVMDVLAISDFPDLRKKSLIRAPGGGSIVLIPREGGFLTRMYVELDKLGIHERAAARDITLEQMIAAAGRILRPYSLEVKDVAWWSVYEIGQRMCDCFDDHAGDGGARIFIAGDACHTHSPKAGQGMNVSMADAFNLGWKLAAVLRKQTGERLLETYSQERHSIARELIDFDKEWAAMLIAPLKDPTNPESEGVTPDEIQSYFVRQGHYTAGTATRYRNSWLTGTEDYQCLAEGFQIGTRLHSAPVIRLVDAKPMQLGHVVKADGRWRLFAFGNEADPTDEKSALWSLCEFLATNENSPVRAYTPEDQDIDAVFDLRAVVQQSHHEVAIENIHPILMPARGKFRLPDREKFFCADRDYDIFASRGIDRAKGCLVIVRPDQYIATILPMDAFENIGAFFEPFMAKKLGM